MAKEIPTVIAIGFLGKIPVVWEQKMLRVFEIFYWKRSQLDDEQTGLDLLKQVQETLFEAINNKEIPLQKFLGTGG